MLQELPFRTYRGGDRKPLGLRRGLITRTVDGPEFMRRTGAHHCAYCGLDMTECFQNWLTMALDHVVPISVCNKLGIPKAWVWDYSNAVLACSACNGFCNRRPKMDCAIPADLSGFYDLRDGIFRERYARIEEAREQEKLFFESRPWDPDFQQTVFEVGGEGGSLSIVRQRNQKGKWEFWAARDETAVSELLSKGDLGNEADLVHRAVRVKRFQNALHSLDKFPWFRLFPMKVHPEFAKNVLREVETRGGSEAAATWTERLLEIQRDRNGVARH
jgi:hypothetical protein